MTGDGWQYGVRFRDGSVAARWNGRTQQQRAEEYALALAARYPGEAARGGFEVVRRAGRAGAWESPTGGDPAGLDG